jgi:hypothetical protein
MYRIGIQLSAAQDAKRRLGASFNEDIDGVSRNFPAPMADVIRLMKSLRGMPDGSLDQSTAESLCHSLGWRKCDHQTLLEMRKELIP